MDDNSTACLIHHAYSFRELDMLIDSIGFSFRLRTTKTEVYLKIVSSRRRWGFQITDHGLYEISLAKCIPNLKSISLWGMAGITDKGVVLLDCVVRRDRQSGIDIDMIRVIRVIRRDHSQPDCLSVSFGYTKDQIVLGVPFGSPKTRYVPTGSQIARVRERASEGQDRGKLANDREGSLTCHMGTQFCFRVYFYKVFSLGDALGIAHHHDAVTGTAKQHTTNDYMKRLAAESYEAEVVVNSALICLGLNSSYIWWTCGLQVEEKNSQSGYFLDLWGSSLCSRLHGRRKNDENLQLQDPKA
ncbi:F-box protein [Cucumis melo var. makuwa]|uniref:F-box protein n=1 Tax=Cucumis melo var. makuwa TaxID=1194695 RepID=A0A5D3D540_CUCMM|nr:F-box protein [Cucumis melo var. makuwa]